MSLHLGGSIPPFSPPILCTSHYSRLQQEWNYLQKALTEEETHRATLLHRLGTIKARPKAGSSRLSIPPTGTKPPKPSNKRETHTWRKVQQSTDAIHRISSNLGSVTIQLQELERRQQPPRCIPPPVWYLPAAANIVESHPSMPLTVSHPLGAETFTVQHDMCPVAVSRNEAVGDPDPTMQDVIYPLPPTPVLTPLARSPCLVNGTPSQGRAFSASESTEFDLVSPTTEISTFNLSPVSPLVPGATTACDYQIYDEIIEDIDTMHISVGVADDPATNAETHHYL